MHIKKYSDYFNVDGSNFKPKNSDQVVHRFSFIGGLFRYIFGGSAVLCTDRFSIAFVKKDDLAALLPNNQNSASFTNAQLQQILEGIRNSLKTVPVPVPEPVPEPVPGAPPAWHGFDQVYKDGRWIPYEVVGWELKINWEYVKFTKLEGEQADQVKKQLQAADKIEDENERLKRFDEIVRAHGKGEMPEVAYQVGMMLKKANLDQRAQAMFGLAGEYGPALYESGMNVFPKPIGVRKLQMAANLHYGPAFYMLAKGKLEDPNLQVKLNVQKERDLNALLEEAQKRNIWNAVIGHLTGFGIEDLSEDSLPADVVKSAQGMLEDNPQTAEEAVARELITHFQLNLDEEEVSLEEILKKANQTGYEPAVYQYLRLVAVGLLENQNPQYVQRGLEYLRSQKFLPENELAWLQAQLEAHLPRPTDEE